MPKLIEFSKFDSKSWILDITRSFGRRGALVKVVEHISTNLLVNILVAQVRVPLVLSVGI